MVLRDAVHLRPLRSFHVAGRAGASTVTPDGRLAALGAADGSVRLLDLRSGRVRTASGRHDGPVRDARFTPDGRTLVTAGEDTRVMLWNVAEARVSETLEGHAGPIRDVAVSPDGKTAYTASLDGSVIAWDLAGTRRLGRPFHAAPVDPGGPSAAVRPRAGQATTPDDGNLPPSVIAATPGRRRFRDPRQRRQRRSLRQLDPRTHRGHPGQPRRRAYSASRSPRTAERWPRPRRSAKSRSGICTRAGRWDRRRPRTSAPSGRRRSAATGAGWRPPARTGSCGSGTCAAAGRSQSATGLVRRRCRPQPGRENARRHHRRRARPGIG